MADTDFQRRDFLRRSLGSAAREVARMAEDRVVQHRPVRPPGALPEVAFLAACTRCDACIDVCPAGAILRSPSRTGLAAGTPFLEPNRIPCIACDDIPCASACPTAALTVPDDGWSTERLGRIEFHADRCVTFAGKSCRVCVDACPIGPAALDIDVDGHPVLKAEGCVGCGVCVRDCITVPSSFTFHALDRR